jgi:hypothetical protein
VCHEDHRGPSTLSLAEFARLQHVVVFVKYPN